MLPSDRSTVLSFPSAKNPILRPSAGWEPIFALTPPAGDRCSLTFLLRRIRVSAPGRGSGCGSTAGRRDPEDRTTARAASSKEMARTGEPSTERSERSVTVSREQEGCRASCSQSRRGSAHGVSAQSVSSIAGGKPIHPSTFKKQWRMGLSLGISHIEQDNS
jgi:hypothetical protein